MTTPNDLQRLWPRERRACHFNLGLAVGLGVGMFAGAYIFALVHYWRWH